jgi:hypothetical protein
MQQFDNVLEVLKLLDKSNCRKCGEKSCMAFAAAVFKGQKKIDCCPAVPQEILARYGGQKKKNDVYEEDLQNAIRAMQADLKKLDFKTVAETIGGSFDGERLTVKIMGKDFSIDREGKVYTLIHVNSWVLVSTFNYIFHCKGVPVQQRWVPFRELPSGRDGAPLFVRQCVDPLKRLADKYPDLLVDMVDLFSGGQVSDQYESDIAVVLSPLPLVPMLICYWKPDDGIPSSLNVFFDATAEHNISIEGLRLLGTGITRMFEKLALLHGADGSLPGQ